MAVTNQWSGRDTVWYGSSVPGHGEAIPVTPTSDVAFNSATLHASTQSFFFAWLKDADSAPTVCANGPTYAAKPA